MIAAIRAALFIAWREQVADYRSTACYALALASMLAPMLTLFALKSGVIETMTRRLLENPATLEILPIGAGRYEPEFFTEMAAVPGVSFITPRTRTISARFLGMKNLETRKTLNGPALIPTGANDPVTEMAAPPSLDSREIVLSAEAARKLEAAPGSRLLGWVERRKDGQHETAEVELLVAGIAPAGNYGRVAIFAPFSLLLAVENFLDGNGDEGPNWIEQTLAAERESYASFRIYAQTLQDVIPVRDAAAALGARVRARSDEVITLLNLEAALDWLFAIIATMAAAGFILSLTASLRANVERLRPTLSMFRLLGANGMTRFLVPVAQSVTIVGAATLLAAAGYLLIALVIDANAEALIGENEVLLLTPGAIAMLAAVLLAAAALSAVLASRQALTIGADEIIRRS